MYSLIRGVLNDINPKAYLEYVLTFIYKIDRIDELLPWNVA